MYYVIEDEKHPGFKAAVPGIVNVVAAATVARGIKGSGGSSKPPKETAPRHEKRVANVFTPQAVAGIVGSMSKEVEPGNWVPCRPMGYRSLGIFHSFKAAWMVFTGRWDVVRWHKQ